MMTQLWVDNNNNNNNKVVGVVDDDAGVIDVNCSVPAFDDGDDNDEGREYLFDRHLL